MLNKNLVIYEIPEKTLKGFTTTEKDKNRGVDKYPPDNFRNTKYDILKEDPNKNKKQLTNKAELQE